VTASGSRVFVVRHGETEWSRAGKHTGRTDVPLTTRGEREARELGRMLAHETFAVVLTSPLTRARETARLAGFPDARPDDDLLEWDYGAYEGRTTNDIRSDRPGWSLWTDGCPNGESPADVGRRADRVVARVLEAGGAVAVFAHRHVLRVVTARWLELAPSEGRRFLLATAGVGVLGYERETSVIVRWLDPKAR
jgi:probable phosphoglycerate mutase